MLNLNNFPHRVDYLIKRGITLEEWDARNKQIRRRIDYVWRVYDYSGIGLFRSVFLWIRVRRILKTLLNQISENTRKFYGIE